MTTEQGKQRIEELRAILRNEDMSSGELHELQNMTEFIEDDDVEMLEAAGIPEDNEPESFQFEILRQIMVHESEIFEIKARNKDEAIRLAKAKLRAGYDMDSGNHFSMIDGTEKVVEPTTEPTEELIDTDTSETLATNLK
jgi:hypothetical protein